MRRSRKRAGIARLVAATECLRTVLVASRVRRFDAADLFLGLAKRNMDSARDHLGAASPH